MSDTTARADSRANWSLGLGLASLLCTCLTGIPAVLIGLSAWSDVSPPNRWKLWVGIGGGLFGIALLPISARLNPDADHSTSAPEVAAVADVGPPAPTSPAAPPSPPLPEDERAVCEVVKKYESVYRSAAKSGANEMKLSAIRAERGAQLAAVLPKRQAVNWVGKIDQITTTSQGKGHVAIELPCGVVVATANNELSDIFAKSLIEPSSPLYSAVSNLQEGQAVVFSATFVAEDRDHFMEQSLTELGSMTEPAYFGQFSSIGPQ